MKVFLTSSPTGPLDGSRSVEGLDEMNGFRAALKAVWPAEARCLMIAAAPHEYERNDGMRSFFKNACRVSGLDCTCFDLLDSRNGGICGEELRSYDVIWLGGGHVPTQHAFFEEMCLRDKLKGFDGIVIGISAGTMNSADTVYCQPEEKGEAADTGFNRWLHGLELCSSMVLPHYQMVKHYMIDGMRLYEDVTYPDSFGNRFICLTDGAYIIAENGRETVFGESYEICDGVLTPLCGTAGSRELI